MSEKERNLRVAETICKEFKWSGQTLQQGDFVALLDGNVITVTDNPDDAIAALRAIEPDPKRGMVVEVNRPVVDVIR